MDSYSCNHLKVWHRAMDLVCASYAVAHALPECERYGLASQLRRAAVSVPANIAEGQSRPHRKDFLRFLSIARASLRELDTHLLIAHRVGYVRECEVKTSLALSGEVGRMLTALHARLSAGEVSSSRHSSLVTQHTARRNSSQSRIP